MIPSQERRHEWCRELPGSFVDHSWKLPGSRARARLRSMTAVILGMVRAHTAATGHWLALLLGQLSSHWELQAPQTTVALLFEGPRASSLSRASSMRSCS